MTCLLAAFSVGPIIHIHCTRSIVASLCQLLCLLHTCNNYSYPLWTDFLVSPEKDQNKAASLPLSHVSYTLHAHVYTCTCTCILGTLPTHVVSYIQWSTCTCTYTCTCTFFVCDALNGCYNCRWTLPTAPSWRKLV